MPSQWRRRRRTAGRSRSSSRASRVPRANGSGVANAISAHSRGGEELRNRLPVRLKVAVVTAALTFGILCVFSVVIGVVAEQRIRAAFDDDLRATTADLVNRFDGHRDWKAGPYGQWPRRK